MLNELLHITTRAEWDEALKAGRYAPRSLASEGFIHLSTPSQLAGTAARFFAGQRGLLVLVIDPTTLEDGVLRFEPGVAGEGQDFPHLYRALLPQEVVEIRPLDAP